MYLLSFISVMIINITKISVQAMFLLVAVCVPKKPFYVTYDVLQEKNHSKLIRALLNWALSSLSHVTSIYSTLLRIALFSSRKALEEEHVDARGRVGRKCKPFPFTEAIYTVEDQNYYMPNRARLCTYSPHNCEQLHKADWIFTD